MGSLQVLTEERDKLYDQTKALDEIVMNMGGPSAFAGASSPTRAKRAPPRAPSSPGAQAKRRIRVNTQRIDHFVLQSLIDNEDFMKGSEIEKAVSEFGFEINGIQMRASVARLIESNKARDNGELRAKKRYSSIIDENDIELPEEDIQTTKAAKKASSESREEEEEEEEGEAANDNSDIAGALDDSGTRNVTAKNAIVMALAPAKKGLGLGDLVKQALGLFPGKFSDSTLKKAVTQLAKNGDISKKKKGKANIYLLSPQTA